MIKAILTAFAMITTLATFSAAAEQAPPNSQKQCEIDTTKETDTGRSRNGVSVCHDDHSVSVGGSVSEKEVGHFLKYPIGQSKKSVAKQIGDTVHNFFHHL